MSTSNALSKCTILTSDLYLESKEIFRKEEKITSNIFVLQCTIEYICPTICQSFSFYL